MSNKIIFLILSWKKDMHLLYYKLLHSKAQTIKLKNWKFQVNMKTKVLRRTLLKDHLNNLKINKLLICCKIFALNFNPYNKSHWYQ
jgi:hypothetical protein